MHTAPHIGQQPPSAEAICRDSSRTWSDRCVEANRLIHQRFGFPSAGSPSAELFAYEAHLLGSTLERHSVLVRIDGRDPSLIGRAGFSARETKNPGTLFDHIDKKGTSNRVSTSYCSGNENVCAMLSLNEAVPLVEDTGYARLKDAAEPYLRRMLIECSGKEPGDAMQTLLAIEEQANNFMRETFGRVSRTFRAYEYAIADVVGVKIPHGMKGYSYSLEDEVVVGAAEPDNVIAYREVTIKDHWSGYYLIKRSPYLEGNEASFGSWKSMDGGELTNETFSRLSILRERAEARERAGFSWQDYRQGPTPERLSRLIDAMILGDSYSGE